MTATIVEIDTTLLDRLDFESQDTCDSSEGCDKKPDWSCKTNCCHRHMLVCNHHFHKWRDNQKTLEDLFQWGICPWCFSLGPIVFDEWISYHKV